MRHSHVCYFWTLILATLIWRQPDRLGTWMLCGLTGGVSLLFTQTAWSAVAAAGVVLGLFDSPGYTEATAELRRGDVLVVFSDGITETLTPEDEEFGESHLTETVLAHRHLDAAGLQAEILRTLEAFAAGARATDDRTLIVPKREA